MGIQAVIPLNIDFCNKRYVLVNAKQYDRNSRFLLVTCYNGGTLFPLAVGKHDAYIRYKKADGHSVFKFCSIENGKVLVELTEQMLAAQGSCLADLVIVDKGKANIDSSTGEIVSIPEASVISTMPFYISVTENPIENAEIESTFEYSGFNEKLKEVAADFSNVIKTAKSWAVGGTGVRAGENTDNAKYYSEQAKSASNNADGIRDDVLRIKSETINEMDRITNENIAIRDDSLRIKSETLTYSQNAKNSETNAANSAANAETSAVNALNSEQKAKASENASSASEQSSKAYMDNAKVSEDNAKISEANAANSENNAKTYMNETKTSENNAFNYANKAQSYAVGGTGTRQDEDTDNAYYYYEMIKTVIEGLQGGYMPMGTISFSELATVEKATGYVYNMREDFVTDESFREGAGKSYTAGVNVYYTADGQWDCLGGAASPTATVSEVKDYLGI